MSGPVHLALLTQLATTLPLVGLIWFVQVVAYPLFGHAGALEAATFRAYHRAHSTRITWIVLPLMVCELVAAGAWLARSEPGLPRELPVLGFGLVVMVWLATGLLSVPRHDQLARGYDAGAQARLVSTNWVRTACWTARAVLLLWVLSRVLGARDVSTERELRRGPETSDASCSGRDAAGTRPSRRGVWCDT